MPMPLTLTGFANDCCRFLPDGWEVMVICEKDAGDVQLWNPDGDEVCDFSSCDVSFEDRCKEAIDHARKAAGLEPVDWRDATDL